MTKEIGQGWETVENDDDGGDKWFQSLLLAVSCMTKPGMKRTNTHCDISHLWPVEKRRIKSLHIDLICNGIM